MDCGYHMLEWVRQIVERGMEEWKKGGPVLDYNTQAAVMQIQSELQKIKQKDKQTKDKERTEWDPKAEGEVEVEGVKTQEQKETATSEGEGKGTKKVEKKVSALEILKQFNEAQKVNKSPASKHRKPNTREGNKPEHRHQERHSEDGQQKSQTQTSCT